MSEPETQLVFVVSAPSGAGKSSLADEVIGRVERLTRTVSATTRAPRGDEHEGHDYFFVDEARFEADRKAGEFLESATVHDHRYGTLRSELRRIHDRQHDAIMVIDVQGAASVRACVSDAISIFILPPSRDVLVERLFRRDGDADIPAEVLEKRLQEATHEIARYVSYDYVIVNDDFQTAAAEFEGVVRAERCRRWRRDGAVAQITRTFERPGDAQPSHPRSAE